MAPNDYYNNLVALRRKFVGEQLETLFKKKKKTQWITSSTAVNAYYDLKSNQIVVPAGILQSPAFSIHQPAYVNYGGIGFIIGHELTHAFDVQGATRNAQGDLENWWTNTTAEKFYNRTQCMAEQYSNYSVTFDGNVTKSLNG
jgi:predicted metalloendopeptidase